MQQDEYGSVLVLIALYAVVNIVTAVMKEPGVIVGVDLGEFGCTQFGQAQITHQ